MRRIATASPVLLLASTALLLGLGACSDSPTDLPSFQEELAPPATVMSSSPHILGEALLPGETFDVTITVTVPFFPTLPPCLPPAVCPPPPPNPSLTLVVNPGTWAQSVSPSVPFVVSAVGQVVTFTIDIGPPAGTGDGIYEIAVSVFFLGSQIRSQTVTIVVDTTAPVITLLGSDPVNLGVGDTYTDEGASADDNIDGDISGSIITVNPVDTNVPGIYTVTYNVSDAAGNPAVEVTRTVTVVDNTPPVITLLGTDPADDVEVGDPYTDAGATAWDNVDGDITASILTDNPVDTNVPGIYTVTYNVSDAAGNVAVEVTRTVTVVDGGGSPPGTDTPRATAEATLDNLSPFVGESKKFRNAVRHLNRSLEARLWLDDLHLAARHGNRVFDRQKSAVKDLMYLLKRPRGVSAEALAAARDAIDDLVPADRLLAQTALDEVDGIQANNPRRQRKVDRELAKAHEDLDKGDAEAAAGKFDKAINHYKKAWQHAMRAAKHAAK